ncbi:MAG: hypothetical protein JEZ06_12925 [Anaerolineaceae bacterium]|nr:hypothetical protein [Anaerolineaceae bacterium]
MFGSAGFSVISEGVFYVPIYVLITLAVYLLGYHFFSIKKIQERTDLSTVTEIEEISLLNEEKK